MQRTRRCIDGGLQNFEIFFCDEICAGKRFNDRMGPRRFAGGDFIKRLALPFNANFAQQRLAHGAGNIAELGAKGAQSQKRIASVAASVTGGEPAVFIPRAQKRFAIGRAFHLLQFYN